MRSYLTIDFLISLGMFFTTIIILSHIIKPITPNKAKLMVKQSEKGTNEFFKNLSSQYVNTSNEVIFNYSMIGYTPYSLSFKWYTLCSLYNTTHTAICSSPPCPINFYSKNPSPYTTTIPSGLTELSSSDIVSKLYLPIIGFFMPVDQNGNNFASPWFDKKDLKFYSKYVVNDVKEGKSAHLTLIFDPNVTIFKQALTYTTNDLTSAQNELSPEECKKYGCVLYERIVFKASPDKQYFIYVSKCNGYCLVFFNGYLLGSIAPYTGMYLPTGFLFVYDTSWSPLSKDSITVVSIINKKPELPAVSFKIYSKSTSFSWFSYSDKCLEYFAPKESEAIISRPVTEIISPPSSPFLSYSHFSASSSGNIIQYKLVKDKKSSGEVFINGIPFYSVYFPAKTWGTTSDLNITLPNTPGANSCMGPYVGMCSTDESFEKNQQCKKSITYLESSGRIGAANDLLARIPFIELGYRTTWFYSTNIQRVILIFRSDDGADVWFNGVRLLNRIHDNHPPGDSLYGLVITRSNYTKLWIVTWGVGSKGCKVVQTPNLFRVGNNVLSIWVANGGDENWGCGAGALDLRIFRIYEKLEF